MLKDFFICPCGRRVKVQGPFRHPCAGVCQELTRCKFLMQKENKAPTGEVAAWLEQKKES